MPDPLPLPIRVLAEGASTVGITSDMSGPRSQFAFPRAIEAELLRSGRPAVVQARTVPSDRAKAALRRWEHEVIGFSPDVVILAYGHYEGVHLFLPWALERHANSWRARPGRLREFYRRRILRPVWLSLAKVQAKADARWGAKYFADLKPRRVAADLERLVRRIRTVRNPLVLVLEVPPPGSARYRGWFPGMAARVESANRLHRALVERMDDPEVRFVPTADVMAGVVGDDLALAMPDGFHWTPELHHLIGQRLADEIRAWADTQDHLKL